MCVKSRLALYINVKDDIPNHLESPRYTLLLHTLFLKIKKKQR